MVSRKFTDVQHHIIDSYFAYDNVIRWIRNFENCAISSYVSAECFYDVITKRCWRSKTFNAKGSFTHERSRAERSKDHNKAATITTNTSLSIKTNWKWSFALLRYVQVWTSLLSGASDGWRL